MVMRLKRTIALIGLVAVGVVSGGSQARAVCDPAPPTSIGDVNGSGAIDVTDVLAIIKIAFVNGAQSRYLGSDDLDGNGVTDVSDVLREISIAFVNGSTVFPHRMYRLTGRTGPGKTYLVKDPAMDYRIFGNWNVGTDDVNGSMDTVSVCPKIDTLVIPPGVTVTCDTSRAVPSAIIIRRTGFAQIVGTRAQPILFISPMPPGLRNKSDWGGFVINGAAPNNNRPTYIENTEGGLNVGIGGGNIFDDNSGCFVYLKEEFSGREFSLDNELNGFTVNSVGRGTTLDYIESLGSADDAIEWFGGTVNVRHAVMTDYDDDGFDSDVGAEWKGQFMIAIQDPNKSTSPNHEGFEWDNHPDPATEYDNQPRMLPTVYNCTEIGMGHDFSPGPAFLIQNKGIHLRRGAACSVHNTIWTRFASCIDVDNNPPALRLIANDSMHISKCVWYDCGVWADDGDSLPNQFRDSTAKYNNSVYLNDPVNPALATILVAPGYNDAGWPNFLPVTPGNPIGLDAMVGDTPPNDGWFDPTATYVGAVKAGDPDPWYTGWTDWYEH